MAEQNLKQRPARIFSNIGFMLSEAWKISPRFIIGYILDAVFMAIAAVTEAYYLKLVFDRLDSGAPVGEILGILAVAAVLLALCYLESTIYWWGENERQKLYIKCGLQIKLFRHAVSLDIAKYEIPEFYNDFILSVQSADARVCSVLNDLRNLLRHFIQGIAMVGILISLDWFTALFIVICTIGGTAFSHAINKLSYAYDMDSRRAGRIADYVHRVHYLADYAKELRVSRANEVIDRLYEEHIQEKNALIDKYYRKATIYSAFWGILGAIKDTGLVLILLYRLMRSKTVLLGGFALGVTSSWRVGQALRNITNSMTKLSQHSLYIEKLRTFLSARSEIVGGEKIPGPFESLECKDVSFAYLGGTKALQHVSLRIEKGEKVAIVGYNGAGKTTLIKLLMRFYDATEGEILYNGVNIREYDLDAYREKIGAVFQDYKIFAATVAENVVCGVCEEKMRPAVTEALCGASFGARLAHMPKRLDTQLTREFADDGVNLSGGESQKIAIARTLYKKAPVTVMDEPSSALDPVAEYELNQHIQSALHDKTVIFISHRLSTTRDADRIYMFENGRIIECGAHDALIGADGKYAQMFNIQAEKYRA